MRVDGGASTANDAQLFDQPEFNQIKGNFAFYTVVGMSMRVATQVYQSTGNNSIKGPQMWGGSTENISASGPSNI